jgi:hypothetical protein
VEGAGEKKHKYLYFTFRTAGLYGPRFDVGPSRLRSRCSEHGRYAILSAVFTTRRGFTDSHDPLSEMYVKMGFCSQNLVRKRTNVFVNSVSGVRTFLSLASTVQFWTFASSYFLVP